MNNDKKYVNTLTAIIEKAIAGGWNFELYRVGIYGECDLLNLNPRGRCNWHYSRFIFSHDFARAFWGNGCICGGSLSTNKTGVRNDIVCPFCDEGQTALWKTHLQKMVLADDPIDYLSQFVEVHEQDTEE
jgi:hypothetical protein